MRSTDVPESSCAYMQGFSTDVHCYVATLVKPFNNGLRLNHAIFVAFHGRINIQCTHNTQGLFPGGKAAGLDFDDPPLSAAEDNNE
jgi:hypothetical protein